MNSSRVVRRFLCANVALCLTLLPVAHLLAGTITPGAVPTLNVSSGDSSWSYNNSTANYSGPDSSGAYDYTGNADQSILAGKARIKILDLDFNPDPFVLNNILVTNNQLTTQTFTVLVGLPTAIGAPNMIRGNITTSVIDGDNSGSGTVATSPPTPIYQAQIDGVTVHTLQDDPFSVVTPISAAKSASFGFIANAVPVTSTIGILLKFTLTPGDTASILSQFEVVPEPSTLSLATLFAAAVCGIWNRRKR